MILKLRKRMTKMITSIGLICSQSIIYTNYRILIRIYFILMRTINPVYLLNLTLILKVVFANRNV